MARDQAVFTPATVGLIFERAQSRCERCGKPLDRDNGRGLLWSIHHREPRGMGGAKNAWWLALPSNGALLCGHGTRGCHGNVERFRGDSLDAGWLVSKHGIDRAADVPLKHFLYGWCLLTEEGGVAPCETPET